MPLLAPLAVLLLLPASLLAQECIGDFGDDFSDGVIGPVWIPSAYPPACAAPVETGGQVVLSRPSGCGERSTIILDDTLHVVCGDFDVTVDFDLITFPVPVNADISTSLDIWSASHVAVIARYNRGAVDCNPYTQSYKAFIDNPDNCAPGVAYAPAGSSSGKFRTVRVGSMISLQYWDGTWVELKSGFFGTENVVVELWASHGGTFHTGGFDVRYDNLDIQSDDQIGVEEAPVRPARLLSAVPSPFNAHATIRFDLLEPEFVSIDIYSATGQLVRSLMRAPATAGIHSIAWDGTDDCRKPVASGVYFCRFDAGAVQRTSRLVLVR